MSVSEPSAVDQLFGMFEARTRKWYSVPGLSRRTVVDVRDASCSLARSQLATPREAREVHWIV